MYTRWTTCEPFPSPLPSPLSLLLSPPSGRNCRDYDLCEKCEPRSDQIHPPDHIFLKVKVPCLWMGQDPSGFMRPLLPYIIYSHQHMRCVPCHSVHVTSKLYMTTCVCIPAIHVHVCGNTCHLRGTLKWYVYVHCTVLFMHVVFG